MKKKIKKYIRIIIIFNVESTSIILHANKKSSILNWHEYFSIFFSTFKLMYMVKWGYRVTKKTSYFYLRV
jgi:hypothetical protein